MKQAALFSLIAAFLAAFASPALAQDDGWSFTGQTTVREPWLADIGVTRADNEFALETLLLACYEGDTLTLCGDVWNSTPFDNDVRAAVRETDAELEVIAPRAIPGFTLRVKGAVFEIEGGDIYSLRVALDRALGDSCSATGSVELMEGAFEFEIYKVSTTCGITLDDWHLSGDIGLAYNTMGDEFVVPAEARFMRGERVSGGLVLGFYAAEDRSDFRAGLRLAVRR